MKTTVTMCHGCLCLNVLFQWLCEMSSWHTFTAQNLDPIYQTCYQCHCDGDYRLPSTFITDWGTWHGQILNLARAWSVQNATIFSAENENAAVPSFGSENENKDEKWNWVKSSLFHQSKNDSFKIDYRTNRHRTANYQWYSYVMYLAINWNIMLTKKCLHMYSK